MSWISRSSNPRQRNASTHTNCGAARGAAGHIWISSASGRAEHTGPIKAPSPQRRTVNRLLHQHCQDGGRAGSEGRRVTSQLQGSYVRRRNCSWPKTHPWGLPNWGVGRSRGGWWLVSLPYSQTIRSLTYTTSWDQTADHLGVEFDYFPRVCFFFLYWQSDARLRKYFIKYDSNDIICLF